MTFTDNQAYTSSSFTGEDGNFKTSVSYKYDSKGNLSDVFGSVSNASSTQVASFNLSTGNQGNLNINNITDYDNYSTIVADIKSAIDYIKIKVAAAISSTAAKSEEVVDKTEETIEEEKQ